MIGDNVVDIFMYVIRLTWVSTHQAAKRFRQMTFYEWKNKWLDGWLSWISELIDSTNGKLCWMECYRARARALTDEYALFKQEKLNRSKIWWL